MLLDLPARSGRRAPPATLAELAQEDGRTLLRMRVGSLDWMAGVLARLECDFTIRAPDELRASVARSPAARGLRLSGSAEQREQAAGRAGDARRVVEGEADARDALLPRLARVHDAHVGTRQQHAEGVPHLEAAVRAERRRVPLEQQADAVDREVVREAEHLAVPSSSRLPPATSTKRTTPRRSPVRVMIPCRETVSWDSMP